MDTKYTFVRVRGKGGGERGYWLFKPSSETQLIEHWEKYARSVIGEGIKNVLKKQIEERMGHSTNDFETAVESMLSIYPSDPPYVVALRLENEAFDSRRQSFLRGEDIYLNHGIQVVMIDDRYSEIVETIEKDVLTFPDEERPTESDVKYTQWPGGYHIYAKIGKLDVVDSEGKQKWNTMKEAEDAAKWYIQKYY